MTALGNFSHIITVHHYYRSRLNSYHNTTYSYCVVYVSPYHVPAFTAAIDHHLRAAFDEHLQPPIAHLPPLPPSTELKSSVVDCLRGAQGRTNAGGPQLTQITQRGTGGGGGEGRPPPPPPSEWVVSAAHVERICRIIIHEGLATTTMTTMETRRERRPEDTRCSRGAY